MTAIFYTQIIVNIASDPAGNLGVWKNESSLGKT